MTIGRKGAADASMFLGNSRQLDLDIISVCACNRFVCIERAFFYWQSTEKDRNFVCGNGTRFEWSL